MHHGLLFPQFHLSQLARWHALLSTQILVSLSRGRLVIHHVAEVNGSYEIEPNGSQRYDRFQPADPTTSGK